MGQTDDACGACTGLCCKYVAMEIDKPETADDFDNIRWYVSHRGCRVFCDEGAWYFEVAAPCRHLSEDHRCTIYSRRPAICRGHEAENCEKTNADHAWDVRLETIDDVENYARSVLRKKKSPATGPTPPRKSKAASNPAGKVGNTKPKKKRST